MLSTETKLTDLVSRMKEFAGENLESLILYGSAARGDFKEGHSDLNILCILRSLAATRADARRPGRPLVDQGPARTRPAIFHRRGVAQLRRRFFHRASRYASPAAAFSMALTL